jgi:hypothetical protein
MSLEMSLEMSVETSAVGAYHDRMSLEMSVDMSVAVLDRRHEPPGSGRRFRRAPPRRCWRQVRQQDPRARQHA